MFFFKLHVYFDSPLFLFHPSLFQQNNYHLIEYFYPLKSYEIMFFFLIYVGNKSHILHLTVMFVMPFL
jgi:hypothetical protein